MARTLLVVAPLMLAPAAYNLALLTLAMGAGLGAGFTLVARGSRARLCHERELVAALGEPMLAAHPSGRDSVRALCGQLGEYWLVGGRRLLPIVDLAEGTGASELALDLAQAFAGRGRRALLVDADLRAPQLHARLSVPRGKGLADFLEGRGVQLAVVRENLTLLSAGAAREHPLELLSRDSLRYLLRAVAQPFDVVLVRTAPVARGPDFEIFAALAGGALVFAGATTGVAELAALRRRLARCSARVVATVLERA